MRLGGLTAVAVLVAASIFCSAARANSVTQLPFSAGGWIAVDGTNEHVFVSGGEGTSSIVVLDFDGNIVTSITGQQGASGMVVDESTGTLYAALHDGTAISKIDTTTLTETSRISIAPLSLPSNLALAGGKLWFAYSCQSGGAGSIDLDGTNVTDQTTLPGYCPTFATTPADPDLLAAGDVGLSPNTFYVFDVSTDPPTLVISASNPGGSGSLHNLAFSPDALNLLSASGSPAMIQSFLASDLTLAGAYPTGPYPVAVAISGDGGYVAAGAWGYYDTDLFVFPAGDTTPVRSWDFNSSDKTLQPSALAFSPDASKLFAVSANNATGAGYLEFRVYTNPTLPLLNTTTSLTATASTITYGNSVTLKAHVTSATSGSVRLYAQPYGGTKDLLKTGVVNTSGNASFTVKPASKTTYTAEFVEDDEHASSSSPNRTVNVRSRTTATLTGFYRTSGAYRLYRLGKKAYVRGTVAPNHAGRSLKFVAQRYWAGAWRTTVTGTYPIEVDGSSYAWFFTTSKANYRIHCVFAGDADHLGSTSTWKYFRFT
jgi:Big-like domain-containing protein